MTHLRIRKSNTKDGYLMPGLKYGASQVVVAHHQIFVLGQTGLTLDNKGFVGEGNPAQQAQSSIFSYIVTGQLFGSSIAVTRRVGESARDPHYWG